MEVSVTRKNKTKQTILCSGQTTINRWAAGFSCLNTKQQEAQTRKRWCGNQFRIQTETRGSSWAQFRHVSICLSFAFAHFLLFSSDNLGGRIDRLPC